jgi:pimeloyl-ACP methyl ester carboxylesterase
MTQSIKNKIEKPIVFFPGTLCDERIFMPLWEALNSNGKSLQDKAFVPLQWAEDLEQMLALSEDRLAYFPSKVHLFGYSMGGYVAALVALANPNKVASLTLLSSSGKALATDELQQRKTLLTAIKNKQYKGMTQNRIDFMLHDDNHGLKEVSDIVKGMADDLGPLVLRAQTLATAERKNLINNLSKQSFSTYFVVGEQDNIARPFEIEKIKSSSDHLNMHVITGAGHMLPLEQSAALANWMHKHLT